MPKITFTREKKTVECEEGEKLRNVAIANEIQLYPGMKRYFNCHGFGQCGECRVHVTKGMENLAPKTLLQIPTGEGTQGLGREKEYRNENTGILTVGNAIQGRINKFIKSRLLTVSFQTLPLWKDCSKKPQVIAEKLTQVVLRKDNLDINISTKTSRG